VSLNRVECSSTRQQCRLAHPHPEPGTGQSARQQRQQIERARLTHCCRMHMDAAPGCGSAASGLVSILTYQTQDSWRCHAARCVNHLRCQRGTATLRGAPGPPRPSVLLGSMPSSTVPEAKWKIASRSINWICSVTAPPPTRRESNQLRLWFSSLAYVLMQSLWQHCLSHTDLAQAQCGTIRLRLLKSLPTFASVSGEVIALSSTWTLSLCFMTSPATSATPRPG